MTEKLYTHIGKSIARQRKSKCFTQEELAKRTELTPQYISKIERVLTRPSLEVLYRIATALDCSIYCFLPNNNSAAPTYISLPTVCTEEEKDLIETLIDVYLSKTSRHKESLK